MGTFLVAFIIMAVAVGAMAVGVIFGRQPIAGSCGGLNKIDGLECGICDRPCEKRRRIMAEATRQNN
ncbi:MAG: (Na+)-NQR maturation NqrM [Candidatus Competibacteraceae bacterium]|nr:(Na+)-NQR maturation NqrM [Candidatus Competibacteraceae bacterium]